MPCEDCKEIHRDLLRLRMVVEQNFLAVLKRLDTQDRNHGIMMELLSEQQRQMNPNYNCNDDTSAAAEYHHRREIIRENPLFVHGKRKLSTPTRKRYRPAAVADTAPNSQISARTGGAGKSSSLSNEIPTNTTESGENNVITNSRIIPTAADYSMVAATTTTTTDYVNNNRTNGPHSSLPANFYDDDEEEVNEHHHQPEYSTTGAVDGGVVIYGVNNDDTTAAADCDVDYVEGGGDNDEQNEMMIRQYFLNEPPPQLSSGDSAPPIANSTPSSSSSSNQYAMMTEATADGDGDEDHDEDNYLEEDNSNQRFTTAANDDVLDDMEEAAESHNDEFVLLSTTTTTPNACSSSGTACVTVRSAIRVEDLDRKKGVGATTSEQQSVPPGKNVEEGQRFESMEEFLSCLHRYEQASGIALIVADSKKVETANKRLKPGSLEWDTKFKYVYLELRCSRSGVGERCPFRLLVINSKTERRLIITKLVESHHELCFNDNHDEARLRLLKRLL